MTTPLPNSVQDLGQVPAPERSTTFETDTATFLNNLTQFRLDLISLGQYVYNRCVEALSSALGAATSETNAAASAQAASNSAAAAANAASQVSAMAMISVAGQVQQAIAGKNYLLKNKNALTRKNLCLYSNDLTNAAWAKTNLNAANSATGPDGLPTTALTAPGAANSYVSQDVVATPANNTYTFSVSLQGVGATIGQTVNIALRDGAGTQAGNTAVVLTASWQRVSVTATFPSNAAANVRLLIDPVTVPAVNDVFNAWGAQLEQYGSATPLIQTTSASVSVTHGSVVMFPPNATRGDLVLVTNGNGRADNLIDAAGVPIANCVEGVLIDARIGTTQYYFEDLTTGWIYTL